MFDGRTYSLEFENACSDLARTTDEDEIRATLSRIEWILAEAIRGAFFVGAFLQAGLLILPIGLLSGVPDMDWHLQGLFLLLFAVCVFANYWVLRFAFWHEVSRHVKSRRFGAQLAS